MNGLKNWLKRKFFFLPLFFAGSSVTLFAQSGIKGTITDTAGQPVPFASVALLTAKDSSIVKGTITNDLGEYNFENLIYGEFIIKAIVIGFDVFYSPIIKIDSSGIFNAPVLKLKTKGISLKEITVTSLQKSFEFKDGIVTMKVEGNSLTAGNTVFDLIKRMPGTYVDNQNTIFLNGRDGIRIMINGKIQRISGPQLIDVLNGMSAASVSKVEVINNPPAKYDADGTGGIINIVTKKNNLVGFSGNISSALSKGIAYRSNIDASLNYKGRGFTVFSNFSYGNRLFYSNYIFNKSITYNGNTTYLNEVGSHLNPQQVFNYKLGADFNLSDKTTIGFIINGGPFSSQLSDIGINQVGGYNNLGYDHTPFNVNIINHWINPGYNINMEHIFDSLGTKLNFSADYSQYKRERSSLSLNLFLDQNNIQSLPENDYLSTWNSDIDIFTQKLDFQKNISKTVVIETGAKATFTNSKNDYFLGRSNTSSGVFVADTNFTDKYIYKENIYAGYVTLSRQFRTGKVQLGGRGENTTVEAYNVRSGFKLARNYFYFFPNFSIDYTPSSDHYFLLTIARRIDRPGYKELNPYKSYQDFYYVSIGNPYLLPQTVYNINLTYSYKHIFYNTFSYSRFNNLMLTYDFQNDSTKETVSTIRNIEVSNYISYTLLLQKKIGSLMNLTFSGTGFYQNYVGYLNGANINRSAFSYTGFFSGEFLLPKNLKIQINAVYIGPSVNGIKNICSRWNLDIGIKKAFLKEKLTLSLAFLDIFYTNVFSMSSKFLNQDYTFINPSDTRRIALNVSYMLGRVKIQKRNNSSNEQEKQRL